MNQFWGHTERNEDTLVTKYSTLWLAAMSLSSRWTRRHLLVPPGNDALAQMLEGFKKQTEPQPPASSQPVPRSETARCSQLRARLSYRMFTRPLKQLAECEHRASCPQGPATLAGATHVSRRQTQTNKVTTESDTGHALVKRASISGENSSQPRT